MPVNTFTAAWTITPTVIKTFIEHTKTKGRKLGERERIEEATDDIFFDEAFHIVKKFIELGTKNTVESLQAFTNTHVPSPWWAAVCPVSIPLTSCNRAADALIEWFGPKELKTVVGGERWWQVRGLDGLDAEWITEKEYLSADDMPHDSDFSEAERDILRMEHLESVMLYVHGGGFFWGSINTHRYQIIRYARKFQGRAFAVNYRKAPQYPWPCPVQDVLAAYFYLINPPSDAIHKPVSPSKIVFAGDSAGGNLCITVLTVLRDLGLPMPAGAVLISPWVDLTHSFPSVMKNTKTDIIPPHGFLAKPSTLWPIELLSKDRVVPTQSNPPPAPGHPDTLRPSAERVKEDQSRLAAGNTPASEAAEQPVQSQEEMLRTSGEAEGLAPDSSAAPAKEQATDVRGKSDHGQSKNGAAANEVDGKEDTDSSATLQDKEIRQAERNYQEGRSMDSNDSHPPSKTASFAKSPLPDSPSDLPSPDDIDFWQPQPPKVLMEDPHAVPLELRSQIQLYATTEQLTHPLVSPVLQGSLGNLCPLYILAGDGEVLRDEVIYLAHRAAHPDQYPTREGVLRDGHRQKENAEKFRTPTKVHLQVFDGMCHVLTVFSFTNSAKYAYRSIAQFVKHVTSHPPEHLERNPFPELHRPISSMSTIDEPEFVYHNKKDKRRKKKTDAPEKQSLSSKLSSGVRRLPPSSPGPGGEAVTGRSEMSMYKENEAMAAKEVKESKAEHVPPWMGVAKASLSVSSGLDNDIPDILTIRERVNVEGQVRPMEPRHEMSVLQIRPAEVGIIKEAPCMRWSKGQQIWDKRYKRSAERAARSRRHNEAKAERMLQHARDEGLLLEADSAPAMPPRRVSEMSHVTTSTRRSVTIGIQDDRRWGPLDLDKERPPPSAIAKRRDTAEALALLKKNIYHTAPVTHKTIPRLKASDVVRAAFDPDDHPTKPPKQSASEQQRRTHIIPMHGLSIWDALLRFSMRKTSEKAKDGTKSVANSAQKAGEHIGILSKDNNHEEKGAENKEASGSHQ